MNISDFNWRLDIYKCEANVMDMVSMLRFHDLHIVEYAHALGECVDYKLHSPIREQLGARYDVRGIIFHYFYRYDY